MAETKDAGAPSCPKCGGKDWTYTQGDNRLRCPECEPSSRLAKNTSPRLLTDAELMALAALAMRDVVSVLAANQDREDRGEAPAYDGVCSTACAALEAALCLRGVLEPLR